MQPGLTDDEFKEAQKFGEQFSEGELKEIYKEWLKSTPRLTFI